MITHQIILKFGYAGFGGLILRENGIADDLEGEFQNWVNDT